MKISVIIPVYNSSATVEAAVRSVISNDSVSLEVILVDDGSTDGTSEICDMISDKYEGVVSLHKDNGGVSSARNAGIAAATGDFVMFLDSDDLLKADALKHLAAYDADLVLAGFEKTVNGTVTESNVPSESEIYLGTDGICRFLDNVIGEKDSYLLNSSCFKLYRRTLIVENGIRFDESLRYGEDKMFVFSYLCHITSAATVSRVIYEYVIHDDSLSSDVSSDAHISQILMLLERYVPVLHRLSARYSGSLRIKGLYHSDVVSRYVFRILTCFAMRKSVLMNREVLSLLYGYIDKDDSLSMTSVRPGQIPNVLIYRVGSVSFAEKVYSLTSAISRYILRR